jgi:uncharacterized coiled-coil protein SlyX
MLDQRVRRFWRMDMQGAGHGARSPQSTGVERAHRLETLEARVAHLEAELEGLQDAVYRGAVLEDDSLGELRRRTEPKQMARDLSRDARRRGL